MLTSINFLLATYTNTINKIENEQKGRKKQFSTQCDEIFFTLIVISSQNVLKYAALVIQEKSDMRRSDNTTETLFFLLENILSKLKINRDLKRNNKLFYLSIRNSTRDHKHY